MERNVFPTIHVIPGKKNLCGSSTVMLYYHYRMDPNLGEGKFLLTHIHFSCVLCTYQLNQ